MLTISPAETAADRMKFVRDEHIRLSPDPKPDAVRQFNLAKRHDPSPRKIYVQWILRQLRSDRRFYEEDVYKTGEDLQVFERHKRRMPVRDINRVRSVRKLYEMVEPFAEQDTEGELDKKERDAIRREIRTVYDGPAGKVLVPKTERSSCYLGRGTRWCTAATRGDNMFDEYSDDGPLYVMVPAKPKRKGEKYQFHLESNQLVDETDDFIPPDHMRSGHLKVLWNAVQKEITPERVESGPELLSSQYIDLTPRLAEALLYKDPGMIVEFPDNGKYRHGKYQAMALGESYRRYIADRSETHPIRIIRSLLVDGFGASYGLSRAAWDKIAGFDDPQLTFNLLTLFSGLESYKNVIPDRIILHLIDNAHFPGILGGGWRTWSKSRMYADILDDMRKALVDRAEREGRSDSFMKSLKGTIGVEDGGETAAAKRYTKREAMRIAARGISKWAADARLADVERLVDDAKSAYYNSASPILSDAAFDDLVDALRKRSPKSPALGIGAKVRTKTVLPVHMGSLDKVKDMQGLSRWLARQDAEKYVVSDKLDGVSFLLSRYGQGDGYEEPKLYTRGDGKYGQDISAWLPHLDIPVPPKHTAVRGELIMSEARFNQVWSKHAANARNLVSGLVNRRTLGDGLEHVDAIAYEFIGGNPMSVQAQLAKLKKLGYRVPAHVVTSDPAFDKLSKRLARRRSGSRYAVDGLVLAVNEPRKRPKSGNPRHMVAFKQNTDADARTVEVVDVVWRTTRHGRIAPRVKINPTRLSGVEVTWISGGNAAYIIKEKLGPGAVVKVVRSGDVIPYITEVVKPARQPKTPDQQPGFERWTMEGVHAVLPKGTRDAEADMRATEFFFDTMGIEGIKYGTVSRLAAAGYPKLVDIVRMPEEEMVEVLGNAAGRRLARGLDDLYNASARLDLLMAASGVFPGIGKTRLGQAVESLPGIMKMRGGQLDKALADLPGWGDTLVDGLVSNMPSFKRFVDDLDIAWHEPESRRGSFAGETVLFTGFRDAGLAAAIEKAGGRVAGNWSAKVTMLVAKDGRFDSAKAKAARRAGIPVVGPDDIRQRLDRGG